MAECEHCDASFETESAALRHLRDEHPDEFGRIDAARLRRLEDDGGGGSRRRALAAGGVALVVVAALVFFAVGVPTLGSGGGASLEAKPLPDHGNQSLLAGVETFPSEGRDHVSQGTNVSYDTNPPTSGTHYFRPTRAGFYNETPALGNLVHSLEHGAVVIYYDPGALSPDAAESLEAFVNAHQSKWAGVVVVPNPNADPAAPYVLTAWRTKLALQNYDARTVRAFLAEYVGRGPENPVR